jgi:hypothetical protein
VKILVVIYVMLFSPLAFAQPPLDGVAVATELEVQVEDFLLSAAAEDFNNSREMHPSAFRDLRIGHIMTTAEEKQYLLCGQFLISQTGEKQEWIHFATIKTDPFEQWIGGQSEALCLRSSIIWDEHWDLPSKLLPKIHSVK